MTKTTKKSKASKSAGLKRRFDLTNKKVQFFVVIGIVAILGGGYFTFRSFAATTTVYTAKPGSGLKPASTGKNCSAAPSSESTSKGNIAVIALKCTASTSPSLAQVSASASNLTGKTRACFTAKGAGKVDAYASYFVGTAFVHDSRMTATERGKIKSDTFTTVCTPWHTAVQSSRISPAIFVDGSASGKLAVSDITIQSESGTTTPTPAPSPSK